MAIKQTTLITSDISGSENASTVRFSLDNTDFEIDLTENEAASLREAFANYIGHARKATGGKTTAGRKASTATSNSTKRDDLDAVRSWANAKADAGEENFRVASRGRIKSEIVAAFDEAHKG